jgi:hypothetical protein
MVSTRHELAAVAASRPRLREFLPHDSAAKQLCAMPSRNLLMIPYISTHIAL